MDEVKYYQHIFLQKKYPMAEGMDMNNALYEYGVASQAILYSALYNPEFIEVCGSVLLAWNLPTQELVKEFEQSLKLGPKTSRELEESFNFVEIGYMFAPKGRDTSDEEDELLAQQLRDCWAAILHYRYRNRQFVVEVISPEETGSTVGISFYETGER